MKQFSDYPQNGGYLIAWEGYGGHVIKISENEYRAYYGSRFLGSEDNLWLARSLVLVESRS